MKILDGLDAGARYLQSPLLLIMRIFWGYYFMTAGFAKLWSPAQVVQFFESLTLPFPFASVIAVGLIEGLGGLLLIVGLFSRPAALLLAIVMIGALVTTEKEVLEGLFGNALALVRTSPFTFLMTSLIIFAFGPGLFSLDYLWRKQKF